VRVSETVSTAIRSGWKVRLSSIPGMRAISSQIDGFDDSEIAAGQKPERNAL
jgi:hypothetical protein